MVRGEVFSFVFSIASHDGGMRSVFDKYFLYIFLARRRRNFFGVFSHKQHFFTHLFLIDILNIEKIMKTECI